MTGPATLLEIDELIFELEELLAALNQKLEDCPDDNED